jgi:hypothetical protein
MISLKDRKRPTILLLLPTTNCSLPPKNTLFCLTQKKTWGQGWEKQKIDNKTVARKKKIELGKNI